MSHPSALSFESPLRELPVAQKRQSQKRKALHINLQSIPAQDFLSDQAHTDLHPFAGNAQHMLSYPSEWIRPPASLATMDYEGIDLNDEIFFSHNPIPSYTTSSIDPSTLMNDTVAASSSSSSTANLNKSYASLNQHELATSPLKHGHEPELNSQLKHKHKHKRRFSLAAEQLSKMTLKTQSASQSPSPDMYTTLAEPSVEEPTVDPKHLFGSMGDETSTLGSACTVNMGKNGSEGVFVKGRSQTLAHSNSIPASASASASASAVDSQISSRYILPSSVSSPSLTTFFSKQNLVPEFSDVTNALELDYMAAMQFVDTDLANARRVWSSSKDQLLSSALNNPSNPYVMNDECVSAITYWLNNTSNVISDKPSARHTSGVSKPGWVRRNSIPVVSQCGDDSLAKNARTHSHEQKRRRRKSSNNSSISERPLPASLSLNLQEARVQATDMGEQSQASAIPPIHTITLPSSLKNKNLLGEDGARVYLPNTELTQVLDGDLLKTSIDPIATNVSASETQYSALQLSSLSGAADLGDEEPKPFPCPDCEKQFKRSEHLKRHIRSVHSNIRPFHCKYCEKKFSRSDNLAQHSKTHFKVDANGTTSIIYGNPNPQNRGGRKKSVTDVELDEPPHEEDII